jgi:hypothetical protein
MANKPPRRPRPTRPQWTQATNQPPNYSNWQGQQPRDLGQQYAAPYAGGYYRPPTQPTKPTPRPAPRPPIQGQPIQGQQQVPYYGSQAHIEAWKEQYLNAFHPAYGPQYYVNAGLPSAPAPTQQQSGGSGGYGGGWGGGGWGGGGWGGYSNTARDVAAWARLVSWNINR